MSRRYVIVLAVVAMLGASACEPTPPVPRVVFTVDEVLVDEPDAAPGDGVCATAAGACTLRAALDEAATHPRAQVDVVPDEVQVGATSLVVGGDVVLRGTDGHQVMITADAADVPVLVVPQGTILRAENLSIHSQGIWVGGVLLTEKVSVGANAGSDLVAGSPTNRGPALEVAATGAAMARNSDFTTLYGTEVVPSVRNAGTLLLDSSTVGGIIGFRFSTIRFGGLDTTTGGASLARSTHLGSGCSGVLPESSGYNAASDSSCGLTATGDIEDASAEAPFYDGLAERRLPVEIYDAVPVGVNDCGVGLVDDVVGTVRPSASSELGVVACDIGAFEAPTPAAS